MSTDQTHLQGWNKALHIPKGQERVAALLRKLYQLHVGAVAHMQHQGDALLQIEFQRQQLGVAAVVAKYGRMHALQLPAEQVIWGGL